MTRSVKTLVTPEQAAEWLRHEPPPAGVRARNQQTVEQYAAAMRAGEWRADKGDAVHIKPDGTIVEGRHRLSACVLAQTSFETYLLAPRRPAQHRRTKMLTTPERLLTARAAAKTVAEEIAAAQGVRGEALRTDDDDGAERADQELITLRLRAARIADKISMLEPLAEAERQQAQEWPQDLATTLSRIAALQVRHDALARKRVVDRSAVDQDELDSLVSMIPALRKHAQLLERIAA